MSLIIAGERSGVGKTTVTLALLAGLRRRSQRVQSFKVGPDYIDPMFHRAVTGLPCRNLDPVLTSEAYVRRCFNAHSAIAEYGVVEGVMGLFDGAGGQDMASTAHIARLLKLPVVLVIDASRLSRSVAAIAHGYRSFDPQVQVAGVILNRVAGDRHRAMLEAALAPLDLPILGVLYRQASIQIPDRHLGLVPAGELAHLSHLFDALATLSERCLDWSALLPLLATRPQERQPLPVSPSVTPAAAQAATVPIAIAQDAAFNFYYSDNLEQLQAAGAELIDWSPLQDEPLPPRVGGVYVGGGFPELFAAQLADNRRSRQTLQRAIAAGLPTYAECGGLMYLCQSMDVGDGQHYPMVGVLPTQVQMQARLTLGYRAATAQRSTPLVRQGDTVWGHEFHHSALAQGPAQPLFQLAAFDGTPLPHVHEGWCVESVHASYVHLHWGDRPDLADQFVAACHRGRAASGDCAVL